MSIKTGQAHPSPNVYFIWGGAGGGVGAAVGKEYSFFFDTRIEYPTHRLYSIFPNSSFVPFPLPPFPCSPDYLIPNYLITFSLLSPPQNGTIDLCLTSSTTPCRNA